MAALRNPLVTPEEYLERERAAETKSEYVAGEIVAMAGGSPRHSFIAANVTAGLHAGLSGKTCRVATSDLRIGVPETGLYAYPDVSVICGDPRHDRFDNDTVVNPTVIIEALSPSTRWFDRGEKFFHYRHLASLTDYVLVEQDEVRVEHFERRQEDMWVFQELAGAESILRLMGIGCDLQLADIYRNIDFDGPEAGG